MLSNYKTAMSREVRIAIIGMILGLLATIATEEMRCFFLLSKTSKCHQCLQSIGRTDNLHIFLIGCIIVFFVLAIAITYDDLVEFMFFLCLEESELRGLLRLSML
jgi:hypothetical protein